MAPSLKGKEKVIDGKGSSAAAKRKRNNGGDDDKTGGRKAKKRGVLQFFEDAAYEVDNDDGSDDSMFDDDFLEEEFDNEIKFDSEPSSVPYPPLVPKEEEPTEEELEKMLQERYKPGSCFVTYAEDNYESKKSTERNESWPSVKDPTIWKVKCMVGRERHSAFCLMQKYVDLKHLGNKLQIISAFALDHIKGFIYIEADKQCDINEACNGLCSIYSSRVARVPKDDISHLFSVRSKGSGISEGMWTRVKNGKYKGDLAQVVAVNHVQKKVTVKLIPRIDLQALAEKFGRGINANRAVIPAPRLLSSSELKEFRPLMQCRRDRDTNKVYEVLDGMMLKDGYLYKKVSMDSLSFWGATPTDDELLKFEPSKDDECHDLEFLSQLYGERKKKHPLVSDKGGGKGEGSSSSRADNTFEVHDLVFFGRKDFGVIIGTEKDESFKIIKAGSEGPVVVTVQQRELKNASFDKKLFTALDQHTKNISINDTVRVLDGPLKDREGTVKKIYRGIIFLYNESIEENNGYTCFKAQMCEKVELPSEARNEKGGDPGPSVLGDFASSPESPLSPKQSDQGRNGSHNFKREDDAMFSVGQSLRIRVGPLKGYLCRVLAIRRSDITVKLDSQHKILTVKCEHLAEVRSKSSGISLGEDSDSVKPFDLLGTQDGTRDWMEGTAKAAEGGSWNAEGLSTERSSWSAFPASDFSLQQESQPSNPTVDEDADKGYSSWEAKRNPSQGTSWGAAAAARETIADSRQVAGWGNQEDTSKRGAFTAGLGSSASDSWGKAAESLDQPTDEGFKDDSWGRAAGNLNTQDDSSGSKSAWTASGVASPKATVGWGNAGGSSDQSDGSPWNKARTSNGCQAESWAAVRKDAKGSAGNQTAGVTDGGSSWNKQDVGPSWSKQGGGSSGNKPDGGSTSWSKQGGESSWSKPVGGSATWSKPDGGSASQSKPDGGSASWSKPDGGSSSWSKPEAGSSSWSKPDRGSSSWSKPEGGSSSWSKPEGGSSSWSKPDGGSGPWSKPDGGSSSWSKQGGGSSWSKPDGRSKFWSKEDGAMEDKGDIDQHESWGRSESFNRGRGSGGRRGRDGGRGGRGQFGRGRSFGQGETSNWTKGDPDDDGLRDGTFKGHNSSWNSVQSDSYDKSMSSNRGKEKDGWSKSIASGENDGLKWTKGWGANTETSEWGAKSHTEGNDGRAKEQEGDRGHTGKQSSEWQNKGNSNTSKASDGIWSSGWNKGSASNEQNCESKGQDDAWNKGGVSTADQASGWSNGASDSGREQSKSSAKSSDDNWSSGFNKRSIAGEEAGRPVDGGGSWGKRETPAENIKSSWNTSTTSLDGNQSSAWGGKSNWDSQKASIDNPSGLDQKSADSKMDVEADKLGAWNSKKTMDGGSSSGWGQSKWSAATDAGGGSSSGLGQSKWSGATDASGGSSSGWGQSKWSGATDAVGNQNSWSSKSNWNSDNNFGSSEEQTDNFGDKGRGGNWRGGLGGRWGQGRDGSDRGGFGGRGRSDRGGFGGRGRSDRGGFGGRGRSDRGDFGGRGGSDRGGFRGRGGFGGRGRGRRDDWNRSDTGEDKPYSWNNTSNKDVNWTSSNSVGNWNHGASDKGQWQSGSSGWNVSEGSAGGGGSVQASGLIKKVGLSNDTGGSNTQASGWDRGESSLRAKDVASGDKPNSWKNGSSNTAEGWTSNNSGGNWRDGGGDKNHWQGAGSDWKNSKEPAEGGEIEQAGGWIRGPSSSKDGESDAKTGGWNSQENNWKTSNSSGGATSSRWNQPAAGEGGEGTADTRGKAVDNSWGPAKDGNGKGGW